MGGRGILSFLMMALALAPAASAQAPETSASIVVTGPSTREKTYAPFDVFQDVVWRQYWVAAYDDVGVLDATRIGRAKRTMLDYMAQARGCDNWVMSQMGRTPESLLQLRALEAAQKSYECMRGIIDAKSNPKLASITHVRLWQRVSRSEVIDRTQRAMAEAPSPAPAAAPLAETSISDAPLNQAMALSRLREKYRILSYVPANDGAFVAGDPKQDTLLASYLEPCMADDVLPAMRKSGPYLQSQLEDVVDDAIEHLARCVRERVADRKHRRVMGDAQVGILTLASKEYLVLPPMPGTE